MTTTPPAVRLISDEVLTELEKTRESLRRKIREIDAELNRWTEGEPEAVPLFFTAADELRQRSPLGPAVPTRLPTLDKFLEGGFRSGTHVVLVGPPEAGKTTFAGHYAVSWLDASVIHAVLVYAKDEAPVAFINRLAQRLGFDRSALRQHDPETCARAAEALEERWGIRAQFLDPFRAPLDALLEKAAEMRRSGPLLAVVDSLQVAQTIAGAKASNGKEKIDAAMAVGSELASRGDLVLSLSQSSRAGYAEPKNGRDPRAEGSGSAGIEFSADLLLGFASKAEDDPTAPRTVTLRKGRGGLAKGTVSFVVDRETTTVREVDTGATDEAEQHAAKEKLRPYREAILSFLRKAAATGEPQSGRKIEIGVPGKAAQIRTALKALVLDQEVFFEEGPRGGLHYYLSGTASHRVPPRPDLVPDEVDDDSRTDRVPRPSPVGGDAVAGTRSSDPGTLSRRRKPSAKAGRGQAASPPAEVGT